MARLAFQCAFIIAVLFSFTAAADKKEFWEEKPFGEWTEKEVDKMLKNSPWAKSIVLSTGATSAGSGSSRGGGGGEEGGPVGGGGVSGPERMAPKAVITWYARPIREALARRMELQEVKDARERADKLLNRPDSPFYDLLITGWGPSGRESRTEALQKLKEEAYLQTKQKEKLRVAEVLPPANASDPLVLRFARAADGVPVLDLADKEVTLVIKMRNNTLRVVFKFAEMVVNSKLEL